MPWTRGHARRRNIIRAGAIIMLSTCGFGARAAVAPSDYSEPIFGLLVEQGKASFDMLPAAVTAQCKGLGGTASLVFAHVKDATGDAYILLASPPNDPTGAPIGVTMRIDKSGCTAEKSVWTLSGQAPSGTYVMAKASFSLPGNQAPKLCDAGAADSCHYMLRSADEERMLRALVDDAVLRATRAWGGLARFKDKACTPSVMRNNDDYPVVRARLSQLCGF